MFIHSLCNVTGIGLRNMVSLKTLDCYNSLAIEDEHIVRVLNTSENLENLNVSSCVRVTKNIISTALNVMNDRVCKKKLRIILWETKIDINDIPPDTRSLLFEF